MKNNDIFWDYNKVISYNCYLNFLVGERGVGKTFGITKFICNDFLNHGHHFCYIRRYQKELKEAVPNFFTEINNQSIFPNHHFSSKGLNFICNDEIFGHAIKLSTSQDLKGTNFSEVKNIVFDEFMIEPRSKKILFTK